MATARRGFHGGTYKPLSEESVMKIHETVLQMLEEVGFEVHSKRAFELFKNAGAPTDADGKRVRVPRDMAMELIEQAPSQIRLCGQDPQNDIFLGGNLVYAGTGGTALYIYSPETGEKKVTSLEDLRKISKLVDRLDHIHLFMLPTYPSELAMEQVDVNRFFTALDNTSKHVMGGIYTAEGAMQVIKMAEIIAGSSEALRERPLVSMITCVVSPMKIDTKYGDLLVEVAQKGIPVVCPAEPLCGATSPITLAGSLVVQTADSLAGVMLSQIVNPGTPVIFGSVASSVDMNEFKYLAGSIEMGLLNAGGAQMAQFYQLPFYGTGGMSDSKVIDAQCGYESAMTNLLCALSGTNFIHDAAGLMEFAMTTCLEKYVIDDEILGMVMRALDGITVSEDTLAYDVIKQVGPGGNFVADNHTRQYMRTEHYYPRLSNRQSREEWVASGSKDISQAATEKVKELLADHGFSLPADVRKQVLAEISGIVD